MFTITHDTTDRAIESATKAELKAALALTGTFTKEELVTNAKAARDTAAWQKGLENAAAAEAHAKAIEADKSDELKRGILQRASDDAHRVHGAMIDKLAGWQREMAKSYGDMAYAVKRYGADIAATEEQSRRLGAVVAWVDGQLAAQDKTFVEIVDALRTTHRQNVDRCVTWTYGEPSEFATAQFLAKYLGELLAAIDYAVENKRVDRFYTMSY